MDLKKIFQKIFLFVACQIWMLKFFDETICLLTITRLSISADSWKISQNHRINLSPMHIALIFDFEIGKKMILKLLDTGNFAPNSFNVFFGLFWDKLSRELSLESFKFIDRLLTFDFWLRFIFTFFVYIFAQLSLESHYRVITVAVWKSSLISVNAIIWCQIIFSRFCSFHKK